MSVGAALRTSAEPIRVATIAAPSLLASCLMVLTGSEEMGLTGLHLPIRILESHLDCGHWFGEDSFSDQGVVGAHQG